MRLPLSPAIFGAYVVAAVVVVVWARGTLTPTLLILAPFVAAGTLAWRATQPGAMRRVWVLLALGAGSNALGDLAWEIIRLQTGVAPDLSLADVFYLATYPLLLAGIACLVRTRSRASRGAVIDGLAVAVIAALAIWQFLVVNPDLVAMGPLLERAVLASYPLADVLLVAGVVWIILSPGAKDTSTSLLGAFAAAFLFADLVYSIGAIVGTPGAEYSNGAYLVAYGLLAAAALHPSASRGAADTPHDVESLHPGRLVFLGITLLVAPVLAVATPALGFRVQAPIYIGAAVMVSVLVVARMVELLRRSRRDHAAAVAARQLIEHQASHDALTGLPNRRLLLDEITRLIASGRPGELLFVDLDRFKLVNDTLGHRAGDELLRCAAHRIRNAVHPNHLVARLGGDEFVVLARGAADVDRHALAARLIAVIDEPFDLNGTPAHVAASVGVASVQGQADASTALRDADLALYAAKDAGRGRWRVFDDGMRVSVARRVELETALRGAIDRGELSLAYQPRVDPATGELWGFEALSRWRRPQHGEVSPGEFIGIGEATGLIVEVGRWVVRTATAEAARWNRRSSRPVRVSVNASARELAQPGIEESVARALADSGLAPYLLTIELTETFLVEDPAFARARLEGLRRLGVRIEVDDFGTGHSSLAYLRDYPIDGIKLALGFMRDVGHDERATRLVGAVAAMADALDLDVCAEGIETPQAAAELVTLGIGQAQGYFFGRPMGTRAARELIAPMSLRLAG